MLVDVGRPPSTSTGLPPSCPSLTLPSCEGKSGQYLAGRLSFPQGQQQPAHVVLRGPPPPSGPLDDCWVAQLSSGRQDRTVAAAAPHEDILHILFAARSPSGPWEQGATWPQGRGHAGCSVEGEWRPLNPPYSLAATLLRTLPFLTRTCRGGVGACLWVWDRGCPGGVGVPPRYEGTGGLAVGGCSVHALMCTGKIMCTGGHVLRCSSLGR
jgi:hypothetical protein